MFTACFCCTKWPKKVILGVKGTRAPFLNHGFWAEGPPLKADFYYTPTTLTADYFNRVFTRSPLLHNFLKRQIKCHHKSQNQMGTLKMCVFYPLYSQCSNKRGASFSSYPQPFPELKCVRCTNDVSINRTK